ncbi:hypothetical protein GS415_02160 [Rhodococcus hoagii]|nr:hypothetical protein [Prescottella equi]
MVELLEGLGLDLAPYGDVRDLTYAQAVDLLNESLGQDTGLTPAHSNHQRGFTTSARIMNRYAPDVFDGDLLFFTAGRGDRQCAVHPPAFAAGVAARDHRTHP